jgi:hypothetical protein
VIPLEPGDLVAGITSYHDYCIVVTQRGRLYRVSFDINVNVWSVTRL